VANFIFLYIIYTEVWRRNKWFMKKSWYNFIGLNIYQQ
jgi:hypothetical protein